jgi:hypothetical protein
MDKSPQQPEHPPETVLLRYLDGELDARRAAAIREHLEACWQCRTETEELQETIRDYVHFHKARITPSIPRPPRCWHGFEGMLSRAENESAVALGWKNRFLALYRLMPRAIWVGSAVAACAIVLVMFLEVTSSRSNIASAAEILHRAVQSDALTRPDRSRRVRILFRGQAFVRRVGNISPAVNDPIEPLFRSNRLDWSYPLSARAFADWHDRLRAKSDQVRFAPGRIAVETKTNEGELRHASFTVGATDYHPIEESLDFGQAGTVDVTELPDEGTVAGAPSSREPKPTLKRIPVSPSYLPDDVEATVRSLLHSVGADIREVLTIRRSGDEIEVIGVVSDSDRKQEIVNQIDALNHVKLQLQTAQELETSAAAQTPGALGQGTGQNYDAPAEPWLQRQFPNARDREEFVRRALQLSRDMSVRAYALSQLAERYPPAAFDGLSPTAKAAIAQIVADLSAGIGNDQDALRVHLGPLAVTSGVEPPLAGWQSATAQCLALARRTDDTLTGLFAASPQQPEEFNSLIEELRQQLSQVCRIRIE